MLHIITPLYRFNLLEKVYRSLPDYPDITWHISKSSHREKLSYEFINADPRIRLYEIDCPDSDTVAKRNVVFEHIVEGYFYLLDDDTIFLREVYELYVEYKSKDFVGMVIGAQRMAFGSAILEASYPTEDPQTTLIDSGMVLCHHSVLRNVKWALSHTFRDRDFWFRCSQYYGKDSVRLVNQVISVYNYFGLKIKVRKRFLFVSVNFDIYDPRIAEAYNLIGKVAGRFF